MALLTHKHLFLKIVFLILYFYAYQDFLTSSSTGGEGGVGANRLLVYVSLSSLTVILLLHSGTSQFPARFLPRSIAALAVICFWVWSNCFFIYLTASLSSTWTAMIFLNTTLSWVLISRFAYVYLSKTPDAWPLLQILILALFGFYVFYLVAGRFAIHSAMPDRAPVLNAIYPVLAFFPWLLLLGKKAKIVGIPLIVLLTVMSLKRGAICALVLMTFASLLFDQFNQKRSVRPAFTFLLLAGLAIGAVLYTDHLTVGTLSSRFSEEDLRYGSGRSDRYGLALRVFAKSPFATKVIGSGPSSTDDTLGGGAHNEWLEFLLDFGLIGCGLLFLFFAALLLRIRQLAACRSRYGPAYGALVALFAMQSLVSSFYFAQSSIISFMFLGAIEALATAEEGRRSAPSKSFSPALVAPTEG